MRGPDRAGCSSLVSRVGLGSPVPAAETTVRQVEQARGPRRSPTQDPLRPVRRLIALADLAVP